MSRHYHITATIRDKHGRLISTANNSYVKTHPLQAHLAKQVGLTDKIFLHAEVRAILRAGRRIKDAYSIEVSRYDSQGRAGFAKPCSICMELIRQTPIQKIIYTKNGE